MLTDTRGSTAIKAIIGMGVLAFGLLYFVSFALKQAAKPDSFERVVLAGAKSEFDSERAYEDLERIVSIGPRIPGSPEAKELRGLIRAELEEAGLDVMEWPFTAQTPIGERNMVNVVGVVKGTKPGRILLGNHYDTKYFPNFRFVGANDGGSTTAWMIEMARTLGPRRDGRTIWLCFFDGEEAFEEWTETDSLYGSRAFVARLARDNELDEVHALVNVDMIGDCYLGISQDPGAPDWLTRIIWNTAKELGYDSHFLPTELNIEDDHLPFRRAGVDAINLIDYRYGGSLFDHRRNWHTPNDTLDRVCPESLQAVGDVVYRALSSVEAYLDRHESP